VIAASFTAMGTTIALTASSEDRIVATQNWFEDVEQCASRFRETSDLTALNDDPAAMVRVTPMLAEVLTAADGMRRRTSGLVDPAVGGDVVRWGYDRTFAAVRDLPSAVGAPSGTPSWMIEGGIVRRTPGLRLDLGGIAKGWTADRAVEKGLAVIVSAGGDVRSSHPDAVVQVLGPDEDVVAVVALGSRALATSSVSRRRWRVGGHAAHHIIDPRTSAPAISPIVSATVVAATAVEAEAGAKAMLLHGVDGLAWVAAQPWLDAGLVVWADGSVFATKGLEVAA
jgi:thiamine biosynthesis lipoprotein